MEKRLYRSRRSRMLLGVCGGVAEYFGLDPSLVRLGWIVFSCMGGMGILAYFVCAVVVPDSPEL